MVLIVSGILFAIFLALFAIAPTLLAGIVLLFIAGIMATISGTMIATYIQVMAPREIRGRVMSLYSITLIGLPSLGALGSGAVAQALGGISGSPRAVLIGAAIVFVVVAVAAPIFWRQDQAKATP
jgi:MFS family permease